MLRRFSYPARYFDVEHEFGRSGSMICRIFSTTVDWLYHRCHQLLHFPSHLLTPARLTLFCNAIHAKGSPLSVVWGFVDGSLRPICRPKVGQKLNFSGHKRRHGLKYQGVNTPDGLMWSLHGPFEGRRNDQHLLSSSRILELLQRFDFICGRLYLWSDTGYSNKPGLLTPFKGNLTNKEHRFNKLMAGLYFQVAPPQLDEYLQGMTLSPPSHFEDTVEAEFSNPDPDSDTDSVSDSDSDTTDADMDE